jgi:uncharacterized protein YuzE
MPRPNTPKPPTPLLALSRGLSVTHDPRTNVAYVYLVDPRDRGRSHRGEYALGERAIFDLDAEGRILGFEVLDAGLLLRPETLEQARRTPCAAEDVLDPLDCIVLAACRGERDAIGWLCRTYQHLLASEAADVLGLRNRKDADDVVQSLWLGLLKCHFRFPIIRGAALAWLRRTVRGLAAERVGSGGAR